jgi:hypothetical protein
MDFLLLCRPGSGFGRTITVAYFHCSSGTLGSSSTLFPITTITRSFVVGKGAPQVPPLRYASVGMTILRLEFQGNIVAGTELNGYSPKLILRPNLATRGEASVRLGVLPASMVRSKRLSPAAKAVTWRPKVWEA